MPGASPEYLWKVLLAVWTVPQPLCLDLSFIPGVWTQNPFPSVFCSPIRRDVQKGRSLEGSGTVQAGWNHLALSQSGWGSSGIVQASEAGQGSLAGAMAGLQGARWEE